jgi:hypothetical protein
LQSPNQNQGQSPSAAQEVYVGGTYPATLTRAAQGTPPYRPPQFAFTTPQPRQSQEEYKSTKSHEDSDESTSTRPAPSPKRAFTFEAPMRPLDVARSMYLDYTTTQSIKFYNKGVEKLPGEEFNRKLLLTWLIQVQDKANMYTWTSILTVKGKLLTQNFTEITMEDVRAHAQIYQDKGTREAQKNSIQQGLLTKRKIHHLKEEYLGAGGRWHMFPKDNY